MMEKWQQVRRHLEEETGIQLTAEQVGRLKIRHSYTPASGKTNEHVWPF
jgi:hypothetical protein